MKSIFMRLCVLTFIICLFSIVKSNAQISKDTTVTLKVSGITCGGDIPLITKRVKNEKGILDCKAISKAGAITKFEVKYNPLLTSYQAIVRAVQDAPSCDAPNDKPYKVKRPQ